MDESRFEKFPGVSPEFSSSASTPEMVEDEKFEYESARNDITAMLDSFIAKLSSLGLDSAQKEIAIDAVLEKVAQQLLAESVSIARRQKERERYTQLATYQEFADGTAMFEEDNGDQYIVEADGYVWLRNQAGSSLFYMDRNDQTGMYA